MSAYNPKHLKPVPADSLSDMLREAGRRVLCSSMSVILATSLIPVSPMAVYGLEDAAQQGASDDGQGQSTAESQPEPAQSEASQEESAPASQSQGDSQEGSHWGEPAPAYTGQQSEQRDSGSEEQQDWKSGQGSDWHGDQQSPSPSDWKLGAQSPSEEDNKEEDNKEDDKKDSDKKDEESKEQSDDTADDEKSKDEAQAGKPNLTVELVTDNPIADGTTYYKSRKIHVSIKGSQLALEEGARAVVSVSGIADTEKGLTVNDEGTEITADVVLDKQGVYSRPTVTVTGVTYGEGDANKDFTPEPFQIDVNDFTIVDDKAPVLESVKLKKTDDSVDIESEEALANPIVVDGKEFTGIVVTVEDDELKTGESYVNAVDDGGNVLLTAEFDGKNGGPYTATLTGITGKVALHIVAKGYGAQDSIDTVIGGTMEDSVAKADPSGKLVIDATNPALESLTIGDKNLAESTAENPVLSNGLMPISVAVADECLSELNIVVKDENGVEVASSSDITYDTEHQVYTASLGLAKPTTEPDAEPESILDAGKYTVVLSAKDRCDKVLDVSGAQYPLTIKTTKPDIKTTQIVTPQGNKDVKDRVSYSGEILIVTIEDECLDTSGSCVKLNGEPLAGEWAVGEGEGERESTNKYTFSSAPLEDFEDILKGNKQGIAEGKYNIEIEAKDEAGSVTTQGYTDVIIDGDAPRIDVQLTNPQTYKKDDAGVTVVRLNSREEQATVAQATVAVEDLSFSKEKININISKRVGDGSVTVDETGAEVTWDEVKHAADIKFAEEGEYTVTVSGEDALNNQIAKDDVKTLTFIVAAEPEVIAEKTSAQDLASENRYFGDPVTFNVSIAGKYIDEDATTVAGVKLSEVKDGANGIVTFSDVKKNAEAGTYTMAVTYDQGEHADDLPVVRAKDYYAVAATADDPAASEIGFVTSEAIASFTVDTENPVVSFSVNASAYASLVTRSEDQGKILFFNKNKNEGEADTQLIYAISDNYGIKKVVMRNSDENTTTVYDKEYTLTDGEVIIDLLEETNFDNAELLEVTDYAGHTSTWSLKDSTLYPETDKEVKSPVELVEDHTPPVLELSGPEAGKSYDNKNDDVQIQLRIKEPNFPLLQKYAPADFSIMRIYQRNNEDGSEYDQAPTIVVNAADVDIENVEYDEAGNPVYAYTLPAKLLTGGHYRVEAGFTDLAGNPSNTPSIEEFTVDADLPTIGVAYADGETSLAVNDGAYVQVHPETEGGLTATITVEEHNFDPDVFSIKASQDDARDGDEAFVFEYRPEDWVDNGDWHTYTINFRNEGTYTLSVSGKDMAGNPAVRDKNDPESKGYDCSFTVDKADPDVKITYPSKDAQSKPEGVTSPNIEAQYPSDTDHFVTNAEVSVEIIERYLDEVNTKINTVSLATILEGKSEGCEDGNHVKYVASHTDGSDSYIVTVTYPDGEYDALTVEAVDKSGRTVGDASNINEHGGLDRIVVDTKAPIVNAAYIKKSPETLEDFKEGFGRNGVYFFTAADNAEKESICLQVTEPHGIYSIELIDETGSGYVLAAGNEAMLGLKSEEPITIKLIKELRDNFDFSNEVKVKITDFAGNYRIWTMDENVDRSKVKEGGGEEAAPTLLSVLRYPAADGNKMDPVPTLLIEDHQAPVIVLEENDLSGVLCTEDRPDLKRFFTVGKDKTISLSVTEHSLKYLRDNDGYGEGKPGLKPDRVVLTVTKLSNSSEYTQSTITVPVSALVHVEGDTYKLSDGFSEMFEALKNGDHDGHYKVIAQLTDAVGNPSEREELYDFTIDTKAPTISVDYTGGTATTYDGEPYYNAGADGLTATITVTEHNFDSSLFTIEAKQIDKQGGDPEPDFSGAWVDNGDTHTYTINFPNEGKYTINVSGTDKAGNAAVRKDSPETEGYTYLFNVDKAAPVVKMEFPYIDRTTGYATPQGEQVHKDPARSTIYYDREPTVKVTIADRFLATLETTVNGVSLQEILDGGAGYARDGITYKSNGVWNPATRTYDCVLEMTYADGEYEINPIVQAVDRSGRGPIGEDSKHEQGETTYHHNQHLVVDTAVPSIMSARITKAPATLTLDTNGNRIANGARNGDNRIYFFSGATGKPGAEKHAIELKVKDVHGIRSIELYDPSGRYALYESSASTALVKNEEKTFYIIDTLADADDFSDEVKVRITDFAGNWHEWTMKDGKIRTHDGVSTEIPVDLTYRLEQADRQMFHPTLLIEDNVAPKLSLADITGVGQLRAYPRFLNQSQSIHLDVAERTLKYLRGYAGKKAYKGLDPARTVLTVLYTKDIAGAQAQSTIWPGATVTVSDLVDGKNDLDYSYDRVFTADASGHMEDGDYVVSAQLVDVVGNASKKIELEKFTIDTKAPVFAVDYNGAAWQKAANGKDYYNGARTATITVDEHNWDPNLFTVEVTTFTNHAESTQRPVRSEWTTDGDRHICTVSFSADGEYQLRVSGVDKAGNAGVLMEGNQVTTNTVYDSGVFVVDSEKPVIADVYDNGTAPAHLADPTVELPAPTGMYNGKSYYSHAVDVAARVKDRNFDASTTTVYRYHNGTETQQDVAWSLLTPTRDKDGYEVYQTSVSYTEDGDYQTPHVKLARDSANNESENTPRDFVVDLVAPSISVSVDQAPTSTGAGNEQGDPIQFFNVATRMTFDMYDLHLLRSYTLDDPEGEYVIATTTQDIEGKQNATLVIELRDGATIANDTEYERDITLTVQDLAGNQRIWTIDRTGRVVADRTAIAENNAANTSINNADIYPVSMIQDTTAPTVRLEGPPAGSYSNSVQHVRAYVDEFNFEYLQRFDPSRVIMTVTKQEGNASRAVSTWVVPSSNFSGSRPSYTFDQPFEGDGHYSVVAEFLDYANNPSNRATLGEFTVDMTAPRIEVTWNKPAGKAPYYRETRVATITVTEHNFDPALFNVNTTGIKSGWSSNGDVHTMTVTFSNDGTYTMTITGKDRAGNEAAPYTERQFTIDKTAPKIAFSGRVQRYGVDRGDGEKENEFSGAITKDGEMPSGEKPEETLQDHHAYNGVVMPSIEFIDQTGGGQTNYDSSGVNYTITGGKHGKKTELVDKKKVNAAKGGEVYQFEDFGLLVENDGDAHNVYDPEADDVYTIKANMEDKAGNKAEGTVTFSVNRYGSNFVVTAYDGQNKVLDVASTNEGDGQDYDLVGEAPRIEVHEINVSGSESDSDHSVLKEYANAVDPIDAVKHSDKRRDGYEFEDYDARDSATKYGWYEYVYTIRSGNFGTDSPSDSGDGGQGVYRVNVASVDRASNDTSSAEYLSMTDYEKASDGSGSVETIASSLKNATATFTLDQIAPAVDEFSVPNMIALGTSYTVRAHVSDAITKGDTVKVYVDGVDKTAEIDTSGVNTDGTGTYQIAIPASFVPFTTHEVKFEASDGFEQHEAAVMQSGRFMVTTLVPEIAVVAAVVGVIVGGVVFYRKRKEVAEPETPGSYE